MSDSTSVNKLKTFWDNFVLSLEPFSLTISLAVSFLIFFFVGIGFIVWYINEKEVCVLQERPKGVSIHEEAPDAPKMVDGKCPSVKNSFGEFKYQKGKPVGILVGMGFFFALSILILIFLIYWIGENYNLYASE